ncbi:hypothetical protein [Rhizobium sp.]|uniref:hypothetical protein n=1 Tax=Rhizobium sp. TaxID=391 RepID=UPI0034C6AA17
MMPLIREFINRQTRAWFPKMVVNPVQERLLDVIAAKRNTLKNSPSPKSKTTQALQSSNVINIRDAVKKSVEAEKRVKR